jgi:NTE family protein
MGGDDSLFDTQPQRKTLECLIEFDRIGTGGISLVVTAVDEETGEDIVFDSDTVALNVDHIMASTALPIFFPPVELGGRTLVDPGVSANLPIASLLSEESTEPVTCVCLIFFQQEALFLPHLTGRLAGRPISIRAPRRPSAGSGLSHDRPAETG